MLLREKLDEICGWYDIGCTIGNHFLIVDNYQNYMSRLTEEFESNLEDYCASLEVIQDGDKYFLVAYFEDGNEIVDEWEQLE